MGRLVCGATIFLGAASRTVMLCARRDSLKSAENAADKERVL